MEKNLVRLKKKKQNKKFILKFYFFFVEIYDAKLK